MKARILNKRIDTIYFSNGRGLWRVKNNISEFFNSWGCWSGSYWTSYQLKDINNNIKKVSKSYVKEYFPKALESTTS